MGQPQGISMPGSTAPVKSNYGAVASSRSWCTGHTTQRVGPLTALISPLYRWGN